VHRSTPEPVALLQPIQELAHIVERNVLGASAHFADDVMMLGFLDQVDDAGTMPEMDVVEMAGEFEGFNRSIDRRRVDGFAQLGLSSCSQIGGGEVLVMRFRQNSTDSPPGSGYP
jgi:hypothetical protein